ncbi:MAG: amino acid adenylation domain-containing protein [Muribaculaceae bacterium]|nr:amino acid adenylation domain-containing protein [Muribaculaceae bacterium]
MTNDYLQPFWDAFENYAGKTAVVDKGGRFTSYSELGDLTRRIAAGIKKLNLPPNSFIPIYLPTSMEYMASQLAVWMTGHAVVPMGHSYPKERIEFIKAHSEAPVVIDEEVFEQLAATLERYEGTEPLDMKSNALMIYTSGSTGEPKGIIHTFESLDFAYRYNMKEPVDPSQKWGATAPPYFIAGVTINTRVLKGGGELHLYDDEIRFDVNKMADYIADHGITHTFISPSALTAFHNHSDSLKVVYAGSEKLSGQQSREGYTLYNVFGMSEMVGGILSFRVDKPYDTTPIGKPDKEAPAEFKIVDADGNTLPDGEEGELWIKGPFTKGYHKDPERTAKVLEGGWLHTGDIMKFLPDGSLLYVNRKDWMVKINGQRVEPGEVEAAMKKVAGVTGAIVKGFDSDKGSQFICGYYTSSPETNVTPDTIREELLKSLPSYMIPLHIVRMDKFPVLPNGKVNRKILQPPTVEDLQQEYIEPRNETEKELCEAYEKVFDIGKVGIDDDFFMLGGDSIKVMKLQQICKNLNLTSKLIYSEKTPRRIAELCEKEGDKIVDTLPDYPVPLTQTQLGIFAESMARRGEAVYNNPLLLKLDDSINLTHLAESIQKVIGAHQFVMLKIREDEEGNPQMIADKSPYHQTVEKMTDSDFQKAKGELIRPFDLLEDPLFRIRIIETESGKYLFLDFHHIIYDGTSMAIFANDLESAYKGEDLKEESWSGFNVAEEERRIRETPIYTRAKEWYEENFGSLEVDSMPLPDVHEDKTVFASLDFNLGVNMKEVDKVCERFGITANIFTLGAFGRLIGAFTNLDEALFATIYNGRESVKVSDTIDMMVKTLPVYCKWDTDTALQEYFRGIKEKMLGAMNHDIYSFAEISASTGINSDLLFAYQGDYLTLDSLCGLPVKKIELDRNATGSPLDFQVFIKDGELVLHAEYMSNRYSENFIKEISRSYGKVLQSMMNAEIMSEVEFIDETQRNLLDRFNKTEVVYDKSQTVVSLFEKAVQEHSENTAVIYEDKRYSYKDTDLLTGEIAHRILQKGLGGEVIAILIPRSEWMVMASLGSLRAGCPYQPLDNTYPSERLNFMVKDSGAKLLLTTPELRNLVDEYEGEVLMVTDIRMPQEHPDLTRVDIKPDNLFTLLYTSGSTGVPKGVKLTHSNLVCFIHWYNRYYALEAGNCVGAYASYGFDANMMDMYPALTQGASVCIIPEDLRLDMERLNEYLIKNKVTHQFMTTQVGRQFASDIEHTTLKYLSMGGEKLIPFPIPENYNTYNAYGPTECTIFSTIYPLHKDEKNIFIGRVIDNMKGYVVGKSGKRLPVGAVGELWLAGPQIARGYLNRPDKTAEVFITNPFDEGEYTTMYKTGDVVRYTEDGNIDFIGRSDGQVKIRGFRIELSEVEGVIREFPGVKDATVAAFDHPSGGKYIVAYVVGNEKLEPSEIADFVRERKPPYMVPGVIMQIERIPLNQNHKVNRKALPKPEFKGEESEDNSNRPLNNLEKEIIAIVGKVLGIEEIGVGVSLSNLGLTSILSIKLASQLYKRFNVEIPSKELLGGGTVESIENLLLNHWMYPEKDNLEKEKSGDMDVMQGDVISMPLSFPQTGVYFECMKRPADITYNIPAIYHFGQNVDATTLAEAVRDVVKAHPGLQTRFANTEEGVMQHFEESEEPVVEILKMPSEELEVYKKEFVKPFHLVNGPLYRIAVVETEKGVDLLTDFHHLVFDGSSLDIFLRQLHEALHGNSPTKEEYDYLKFVRDEKNFESSEKFEENKKFFDHLLSEFENASEVSGDLKGKEENGKLASIGSPIDLKKVEEFARQQNVTPAAVMLAATFYTISRYINDSHVYLSTISSGRSDVKTGESFGMFVNTLPLGIKIGDESVEEFVKRSANVFQGVIEHEKYPFARISADFGFQPQIVYEYQLGVVGDNSFPEMLGMESLELNTAKFKLSIHIEDYEGKPSAVVFYNDALYSRGMMEGLAKSISIVTEKIVDNPKEKIKRVSLIDEERERKLETFRTVATFDTPYKYYQEAVEEYASKTPQRKALVACDAEYTYAEFDAVTNVIANNLIKRGVTPRSRVALLLPRTSRVILGMFGVMKAGCAYIPCDPEYPTDRIQHILDDSEAAFILTTSDRLQDFPNAIDVETLLDGDNSRPTLEITPQDLAYLIYTSGSTGRPKGVMLRHESIANYLYPHRANTHINAIAETGHTMLSITTISFDMSLKEIGAALCNGLTLVFASEEQTTNPITLAKLFKETGADVFNTTPSRMLQFMELPAFAEAIGQCKVIMCGGEKYADGLLDKLRSAAPEARIFNTYGPTEITVSCNCKDLTHTDEVNVGKPLLNVTEFVVDKDSNELPAGIVGELYIGGEGVATGYNNLPEMTAERFIDYKGMRIYKSGDYARWTENGDVQILGRTDNQIKLRGLRIELGEVEAAIAAIEGIKNVVVKIGKIKGEEHLAAYFTADHKIDIPQLKKDLGKTLTKYMVPTAYLQMEKMPLTPNGKTDVKSLPEPEVALSGDYEAPRNETEQKIADIFAKILKLDKVGANDNFYEMGGTSLVTTRVIIETDKLGYNVAYGDVFSHPTPRKLANFILGVENDETGADEVADYDYSDINEVLSKNTLPHFQLGESQELGKVLLTGATGYLGIHILRELIDSDAQEIWCLVRGKDEENAASRLKTLLFYYFENTFESLFGNRLHIILGDVTSPIPSDIVTDTLINCAAVVKHFAEGTEIEDVNVGGVEHCLNYCKATGAKMIQISTASTRGLSVNGIPAPGTIFNEEKLYIGQFLGNKYIHSKFIAERMVLEAVAKSDLTAKIMRVGNLAPRSSDGEFQANFQTNSFMGRLKVYNMLGCCPYESRDGQVEFSPIDEVARAIVLLSTTPKECVVFHPYNNHGILLGDVLTELKHVGEGVRFVELGEFSGALEEAKEDPNKARQLSSLLAYQNMAKGQKSSDVARQNSYTMQVLYRLGFSWSTTSWDYIDRFMKAIQGLGFFD